MQCVNMTIVLHNNMQSIYFKDTFNCEDLIMRFSDPAHLVGTNNCDFISIVGSLPKEISRFTYFIILHGARVSAKAVSVHHRRIDIDI